MWTVPCRVHKRTVRSTAINGTHVFLSLTTLYLSQTLFRGIPIGGIPSLFIIDGTLDPSYPQFFFIILSSFNFFRNLPTLIRKFFLFINSIFIFLPFNASFIALWLLIFLTSIYYLAKIYGDYDFFMAWGIRVVWLLLAVGFDWWVGKQFEMINE